MNALQTTNCILSGLSAEGLTEFSQEIIDRIESHSQADMERELRSPISPFNRDRLETFLSPAAGEMLEEMARAAAAVTRQRFGNTMNLYAPMYVSNYCINRCKYCGFNATHGGDRKRLTLEEAEKEANRIAARGFRDLLLVSGEDPKYITVEYLAELTSRLRDRFSSITVEVHTLDEESYRKLFEAGAEGVTIYQETYDRKTYDACHLGGPKANYEKRLLDQEAAGRAGMRRLGIGSLLGISDWRFEALAVGMHAHLLMKNFWRAKVSVSFPRMRPAQEVRMDFPQLVSDAQLVQMMLALRLSFSDIGLVLSTRESATFRDNVLALGITQMSAGSKTNPGGYDEEETSAEQFKIADERSVPEIVSYLKKRGFDPVWKDWDAGFKEPGLELRKAAD